MPDVPLSAETEARLSRLARTNGQTMAQLTERALAEYLDRHEPDPRFDRQLDVVSAEHADDEIEALAWRTIDDLE